MDDRERLFHTGIIHQVIVPEKYNFELKTEPGFPSPEFTNGNHWAFICLQKKSQQNKAITLSQKARRMHFLAL